MDFQKRAQEVIEIESRAVAKQREHINADFNQACELLFHCKDRIVVLGIGKSGHIAGKIAATLASTGSPAFSIHPAEAMHGDLGMIKKNDVVIAISYSGKTPELLTLIPYIKKLGIPLIAMTGNLDSPLARASDLCLSIEVDEEACPLGLAPTASTTATLAMGDALAIALLDARGFTKEAFAHSHPGGNLGKRLLLQVKDFMHTGIEIPKIGPTASFSEALLEISEKRLGMTTIVDQDNHLLGVFTDGDLRRSLQEKMDLYHLQIETLMNKNPKSILADALAREAFDTMEHFKITTLVVTDLNREVLGVLHLHDLLEAGL